MYLGIWCNIPEDEKGPWDMEQVKVVPSERVLEGQKKGIKYYDVITRRRDLVLPHTELNGGIVECMEYIEKKYPNLETITREEMMVRLLEELKKDMEFLNKGVHKKHLEIAEHIRMLLEPY